MTEESLPNGLVAKTTYNEAGEPTNLAYTKVTSCTEKCTWLEESEEHSIYGQDLSQASLSSKQQYSYDKAGRLTLVKDTPTGGGCTTRVYEFEGEAGKDSNRTSMTTRAPEAGGGCASSGGTTQKYSYDAADRLTDEGIKYDSFGRITSLPGKDAGGSTLETTFYSNEMVATQTQNGLTNSYQLDAAGRPRELKVTGSKEATEVFHYAGGSDSPAWIAKGSEWTRSIGGISGELAAIQPSSGETSLQLCNLHGDIVATASLSPTAKEPAAKFEFDEFGNPKSGNAGRFGWLGGKQRRTELPSGVIQMGVRSYVPGFGRFISGDPVAGGSANAYDYSYADPVNSLDLTGETPEDVIEYLKDKFGIVAPVAWGSCVAESEIGPDRQAIRKAFGRKHCIPKLKYHVTNPVLLPAIKASGYAWCIATNAWARQPVRGAWGVIGATILFAAWCSGERAWAYILVY